jgi:ketosteroid isomerase-like protein
MATEKLATTDDGIAIARAAYEAYVVKDREAIEKLIAQDFHFTSPLDNRIDRATYFKLCWPNSERIKAFYFINLVPDGDRVFVTYEGHGLNSDRFRNTEIITVRDGQIVEVEVYFGWSIPHKAEPGVHLPVTEDQVGTVEPPK